MLNVERTIISQYANSASIVQLIQNMNGYLDPTADFDSFFSFVWNVDTAQGFGLDVWGRIVNVNRVLNAPGVVPIFGFWNAVSPADFQPFNQAPMSDGGSATSSFKLPDESYRKLIYAKALANICNCSTPALNTLLRNLFAGRGKCYIVNLGGMAVQYKFEFVLTALEVAILANSNAIPYPTGVTVSIVSL